MTVMFVLSSIPKKKVPTAPHGKFRTTRETDPALIDLLVANKPIKVVATARSEHVRSKVSLLTTFLLCFWEANKLISKHSVTILDLIVLLMEDAQSKLVSKALPGKNDAVELIQTGFLLKLWTETGPAAEPGPITPSC